MQLYDSLVVIGDSWTYGAGLSNDDRLNRSFPAIMASELDLPLFNIGHENASNYCYKWHWTQWKKNNPEYKSPLVIIGVTDHSRILLTDNFLTRFQETPTQLMDEVLANEIWPNAKNDGGIFKTTIVNGIDVFEDKGNKEKISNFYYRYQYNNKLSMIQTLWELLSLVSIIKSQCGTPFLWSNFLDYDLSNNRWFAELFDFSYIENDLKALIPLENTALLIPDDGHPNIEGHKFIALCLVNKIITNNANEI